MTVDAWAMAAECARAVEASEIPTRRAVLRALQKLWIELGEKERLLSAVLKEMEDLHALHVQVLGTQSSAPHARHATGAAGRKARSRMRHFRKSELLAIERDGGVEIRDDVTSELGETGQEGCASLQPL